MVAPRKAKKKKPNTRVIIAIVFAVFLALGLLMVINSNKGLQSDTQKKMDELAKKNQEMEDKIKQQEQAALLQKTMQASANQPGNTLTEQKNTLSVVVARVPIEAGTRLTAEMLTSEEWPQEAVPINAANFPQSLVGRITSSDVASGEPILPNKMVDKDTQTLAIPTGFRAMTIPVNGITGVGGFINPGCRVDILVVMPKTLDKEAKSQEKISKVLVQNVKVLATSGSGSGASKAPAASSGDKAPASSITIAIPANLVTKIALALNNGEGNLQVIMRGYNDEANIAKTEMDTGELISGNIKKKAIPQVDLPKPPSEVSYAAGNNTDLNSILNNPEALPPPESPMAQTKTHSIEVIQANSRQEVSFETEM